MIKSLIKPENPILHKKIKKCSYNLDRLNLSHILYDNMLHHKGVGLSSNQIGINERAFIMMNNIETEETITCFNPRIIKQSTKEVEMEEGCLSYPDLLLKISRPESIVVKYEDEEDNIHKRKLKGFIARIFLHEYDHMEGVDFTQRV